MGQLKLHAEAATSWEAAWTQFGTAPDAYGPSFFISWSDNENAIVSNLYNFADQIGAAAIWNSSTVRNLQPGAWSIAPQRAGLLILP
jgi:hypothetical protein